MNYSKFFGLLAAAVLSALLISCQRDPGILEAEPGLAPTKGATAAQPQIAYLDAATSKRANDQGTPVIKVMDGDGRHQTVVYKTAGPSVAISGGPSWATSGTGTQSSPWRLAFAEQTPGTYTLKTIDVYSSSTGVTTGTNVSTLTTINDGRRIGGVAWRPGFGEVAFASFRHRGISGGEPWKRGDAEIFVTDLSGAVTRIYPSSGDPSPSTSTTCVAWSPTGDTVAFDIHENYGNDNDVYNDVSTVVLMKRDGTVLGQYGYENAVKKYTAISSLDWSRDGKLVLSAWIGSATYDANGNVVDFNVSPNWIDTFDPSTGIFTWRFQGIEPSWSPDASALAYGILASGPIQLRALTSSTYTELAATGHSPAWR